MPVPGAVTDPAAVSATDARAGEVPGHHAWPTAATGLRPGVVVVHDAFGLTDHARDIAGRFANAGYDAFVPDLYHRTGKPQADDMEAVFAAMFGLADAEVVADLDAAAAYLRARESSSDKVGVIGFCAGGRHTLLFAASSSAPDAAVPCWPGMIDKASPEAAATPQRPTPVLDLLDSVRCPVLLVGGAEDTEPRPEVLEEAARRLRAAGKDVTIHIYEGAGHAFLNDTREAMYREPQAHELWAEVLGFFARHLR